MKKLFWLGLIAMVVVLALQMSHVAKAQGGAVTQVQAQKAIEELDKLAQSEIADNAVPGLAIAVVFQDKVVFAKGYGVRDTSTNEPVNEDTVFQLASVSKPKT